MATLYYAKRIQFTAIAIWDGKKWKEDYAWDLHDCEQFPTWAEAQEFCNVRIADDMRCGRGPFAKYGATEIHVQEGPKPWYEESPAVIQAFLAANV